MKTKKKSPSKNLVVKTRVRAGAPAFIPPVRTTHPDIPMNHNEKLVRRRADAVAHRAR
jgi:hypothetical protein